MSLLHLKLILLVAAGLASASPAQAVPRQDVSSNQPTGTAVGGALDLTYARPTPGPMPFAQVESVEHLTIRITNRQGEAVTTAHYSNAGGPAPVSGNTLPGTIANGATAAFAVPTGWAGNVNVVAAPGKITGDDSLIEASYVVPKGYTYAVADVDISYVNGYSVPMSCKCNGVKVTGCTERLTLLHTCPNNNGVGACKNPLRASLSATAPTTFFEPCAGQAYTFPNDNKANSFGKCQGGIIDCCIGSNC